MAGREKPAEEPRRQEEIFVPFERLAIDPPNLFHRLHRDVQHMPEV
jgi:hypothetical protein